MSKALDMHRQWQGKIEVVSRVPVNNAQDLSLAYTPGVAEPCLEIAKDPSLSYVYTRRHNTVAVISDGSAVLGLGNIGGAAGMPVMEGKCVLFHRFGGVDAIPLVLSTQDTQQIIDTCVALAPSFGGINLEDISAPRCFEIERALKEKLDIPVFHDDQHGTAIVVLAAITNAVKLVDKSISDLTVTILGTGAAGAAIAKLLLKAGVKEIIMADRTGILYQGREKMDWSKQELASLTNREGRKGGIAEALRGSDVLVGVSGPGTVTAEMVATMAPRAMVFAMSNPNPEIYPDEAAKGGAAIIGTGRSDYPNQINNVLAFPGIFRGALDARASAITENMKLAAARAIAELVSDAELTPDYILPKAFDPRVGAAVAEAVRKQAFLDGVNRIEQQ